MGCGTVLPVIGRAAVAAVALCLVILLPPAARAQEASEPALFSADEVIYDREAKRVTARGRVEVSQEGRVLLADQIVYDQTTDQVTATGNVRLMEATGEVLFGSNAIITGDLKDGIVRDFGVLLTDDSRLAARHARRIAGNRKELERAVFSPCAICEEDPDRPPVWQIKAVKVVHDEAARDIEYYDATMEILGVPIAYTPYFFHPDPTVDRRSGFLAPKIGRSGDLGFFYQQPYFWDIAPDKDLTIAPLGMTDEGVLLEGEYRQRFSNGIINLGGSVAYVDANKTGETGMTLRGHINSSAAFDFNENWRGGANIYHASGRTYLRRYKIAEEDVLTSRAFTEGFYGKSYALAEALNFQDLRAGSDAGTTPQVLPALMYDFVGEPNRMGAFFRGRAFARDIIRSEGEDNQVLSLNGGWELPITTPGGHLFHLTANLTGDLYRYEDRTTGGDSSGYAGRIQPQLAADWRYPLVKRTGSITQYFEPRVQLVAAPNGGNPDDIPNEDSQDFEFDETNLFALNRFTGIDRVSGGQRVDYGATVGVYGDGGGSSSLFLGQSYQLQTDDSYPVGSGLDDNLSDIVGALRISPGEHINLVYRFRLDKDNFTPRRNEVGVNITGNGFAVSAAYVSIDSEESDGSVVDSREQIRGSGHYNFADYWTVRGYGIRDLEDDRTREAGIGLVYSDECIVVDLGYKREFFEDEDLTPDDTILLRVTFKHLGTVQAGAGLGFGG